MSVNLRLARFGLIALALAVLCAAVAFVPGVADGPIAVLHPAGGFALNGEFPSSGVERLAGPRYASWSGSDAHTGTLISDAFPAGFAVALAVSGYPTLPGESIVVERSDNGETVPLVFENDAGESWVLRVYPLPLRWFGKPVRIRATDGSAAFRGWIGVADVRSTGLRTMAAADVRFRLLGDLVFAPLLLVPLLYGANRVRRHLLLPRALLFAVALLVAGVLAEATFFLTMANTELAAFAVALVAAAGTAATLRALRDARFRADLAHPDCFAPFAIAAVATLGYVGVTCVELGPTSSPIYTVSTWLHEADDNVLPFVMSQHRAAHAPPKPFVREWLSSDRPPLQSGFDLMWSALTPFVRDTLTRYVALSIALQSTALGMIFVLARVAGCRVLRSALVTAPAFFSGFFLQNTIFVWPKLIAAAYIMAAIAIALTPGALTRRRALAIGVAVALGMLSHGGVAFTIPALAVGLFVARRHAAVRPLLFAACAFAVLYAPWNAYQRFYDPPGDRLLKWHLGGHIDPTDEPLGHLLRRAYTELPPAAIAQYKWGNFIVTLGGGHMVNHDAYGRETFSLRYALAALALPYAAALVWGLFSRRRAIRRAGALAWLGAGGVLVWCLLMYGPEAGVIPNGSHANVVLLFAAAGIVATEFPPLFAAILFAQIADFATVWLATVTPSGLSLGSVTPVLAFGAIALIAVAVAYARHRPAGRLRGATSTAPR